MNENHDSHIGWQERPEVKYPNQVIVCGEASNQARAATCIVPPKDGDEHHKQSVPEPSSVLVLATGILIVLAVIAIRKKAHGARS